MRCSAAIGIVGTLYLLMNVSVLGRPAMAGDGAEYRQPRANVHDGRIYGAALRTYAASGDCRADCAGGACFGICVAAGIFADSLCCGARWQFSCMVRSAASEASNSNALASDAWRRHIAVLHLSAAGGHHHAGGDSNPVSVSAAGNGCAAAEASQENGRCADSGCRSTPCRCWLRLAALSSFSFRDRISCERCERRGSF